MTRRKYSCCAYILNCEPPKGTLSEAKSSRRGELIGRVKICTAIKLRLEKKKFVRFFAETASPVLYVFVENSTFLLN